ncbi:MAG: transporter substrate-binding domain-containing protein [Nitratireductor sp.]|nr:transporter substrate-binding domain-containing protein [Nitratireductor sp.]
MLKRTALRGLVAALLMAMGMGAAIAQTLTIPNFWDPNERFVKPDLGKRQRVLFLTTTDFPPFNFVDRKKRLSGFHVDLAREICNALDIIGRCQIQALPWDELDKAMEEGKGEAIIAGLAVTAQAREKYDFSRSFLQIPGRFVVRRDSGIGEPVYEALFRKTIGVVEGSGHQAYFEASFQGRTAKTFPTRQSAFLALKNGEIDAMFTDAVSAAFWLSSSGAEGCCEFAGGPYLSEAYFGRGLAIAVKKGDRELADAFNYALKTINDSGKFEELYLRYFPLGLF